MALKDTSKTMKSLLESIQEDLEKAEAGNKTAAQRVRTYSIRFEKAAKLFRKESIRSENSSSGLKKKKASQASVAKKAGGAAAPKASMVSSRPTIKTPPSLKKKKEPVARKRPTAKLPKKVK